MATAQAEFRTYDRDGNGINDYWRADVAGLYVTKLQGQPIKLIEISCALADDRLAHQHRRTVEKGPFDLNNLICGFWIWRVKSMQEAIDWAKKAPNPHPGATTHLELRQIFEAADFGENFRPELREQEDRLRTKTEKLAAAH